MHSSLFGVAAWLPGSCASLLAPSRRLRWLASASLFALLAACGGAKDEGSDTAPADATPTRAEAARFLTQATFGPSDAEVTRLTTLGYDAWIDAEFAKPQSALRPLWEARDAALKATSPTASAGQDGTINAFWKQAVSADDQLRQRVAFALSEIFVISMQDGNVGNDPRGTAAYFDMLGANAFGTYRQLLEGVSTSPMMGMYLTFRGNQKADPRTGRTPDENYGREVMQLMSIGLHELNIDGTEKIENGAPIDTYGPADVANMAMVFTGWSWACPDWPDNGCFFYGSVNGSSDTDRSLKPMLGYPQYHSVETKSFLGLSLPAEAPADPKASMKSALDMLTKHPNVAPFIARQLIQRLVTSNPSTGYVASVAAAFNGNPDGDLKAAIKAILMNPEARAVGPASGKLREPVLKLSAFLRAFSFTSDTGNYAIGNTDSAASQLGQTPMRSPSVFNFFRPGYVPPGGVAESAGLTMPELQIASETSASGYVNYMRDNVASGVGAYNGTVNGMVFNRRDLQADYSGELAAAADATALVVRMSDKLLYGQMPDSLGALIRGAVEKIVIPTLNATGSNKAAVDSAKRARVNAAVFLTLASPEYQTQK